MKSKVNLGIIGLGGRGFGLLTSVFLEHPDAVIMAVCDVYDDRCQQAADYVEQHGQKRPLITQQYQEILAMQEIDAVLICSSWQQHIKQAIDAMEAGKYVACEVGGSFSVQECWKLVETYERTGTPVMLLENCVYGRDEMMILNMVRQGILGKIVHCSGGYLHDLRDEIAFGKENRHYRLDNYIHRNTENYPTHELGPIAKVLDINYGNRMMTLTSMASKSAGLSEYVKEHKADDEELLHTEFQQGDVINTTIKCANGETICLTLDTTLPRYYSRGFQVQGTKGMYNEENQSIFLDSEHGAFHFEWKDHWGNVEKYRDQYEHPIWTTYLSEGLKNGHGGMDWLVYRDFIESVKNQTTPPIDVYDMASWMCISALSEESIALGGSPVSIPDFTNGAWMTRHRN